MSKAGTQNSIKLVIADDHKLFRQGLAFILQNDERFEFLYDVPNGADLLKALEDQRPLPDVVLLDLKMPEVDGIQATERIKADFPDIKVLVLTMLQQEDFILHLLDLGANGYLLKNASADEVKQAIIAVVEKDFYFTDYVSQVMLRGLQKKRNAVRLPLMERETTSFPEPLSITPREEQVLALIAQELTTPEIADKLFVSIRTIETHRKNLMEKVGAKNTAGLVLKAAKLGLLPLN